jgi:predicted alpha/beta-fold hydrolase
MLLLLWHFICQVFKEYFSSDEALFPGSPTLESVANCCYWYCWGKWVRRNLSWYNVGEHLVCLNRPLGNATKGVVVILPGINGTHKSHYVEQFIHDVAVPKEYDVYVVKKPLDKKQQYGDMKCIEEGLRTLRERSLVSKNVKCGIVGFSAGAIPIIKYIAKNNDVDFALAIGCGFDLNAIRNYLSYSWSHVLYYCLTRKIGQSLHQEDERYALALGYTNVEDFYNAHSCHEDLIHAKVPLYVICSLDDPVIYPGHFVHVCESAVSNPNIHYFISKYGGHLGWRCGRWLQKTLLQEVLQYI